MKPGDSWTSPAGHTMTVLDVVKGVVTVEVERSIPVKGGQPKIEKRQRTIPPNLWPVVLRSYQPQVANQPKRA